MFLIRKITRAKWGLKQGLSSKEIPADAVTVDLRTKGNSLSFWKCKSDSRENIEEVALAIVAAGNSVERLDLICIANDKLQEDGQTWKDTDGRTPVEDLVKQHVDVYRLDYVRLGKIASRIATAIKADGYIYLTKKSLTKLLVAAVKQERIDLDELGEKVKVEVQKLLDQESS